MNSNRKTFLTTLLLTFATTVGMGTPAKAFSFYFGEDLGQGETVRLTTTPKADAARNQFFSNLLGVRTETFESYSVYTRAPLSISFGNGVSANLQGDGYIDKISRGTNGFGRYPISGSKYWESGTEFGISFSQPVAAFGFYGVDIGDFEGQLTLTLLNTLSNFQQTVTIPHTIKGAGGGALYFGLIAAPSEVFNQIVFGNTAPGVDYFAFDDMTVGSLAQVKPQPVPEPMTIVSLLMGGGMLAGAKRWQQRRQGAEAE